MANPFNLPPLGEYVDAGTVGGILVAVGDTIEVDQPVLEIETDKANLEVPSSVSGVVTEILVKNGDQAEVGQPVLMVDVDRAGEGRIRQEDEELLPSISALDVAVARQLAHALSNRGQHRITAEMTIPVVDRLEAIEVEYDERQRRLRTSGALQLRIEDLHPVGAIEAPGQAVGILSRTSASTTKNGDT